jgi:hypothetical protein
VLVELHKKHQHRAKLTIAVKNKWSSSWMKAWFYCRVPVHRSPHGGKSVYALCSHMRALDFLTELLFD